MAAAVADFRPRTAATTKLGRGAGLTLELEPTEDILAEASRWCMPPQPAASAGQRTVLVGFAAETGSLERAPEKAARKRVDLLVANDVAEPGSGFGTDTNRVTIIRPGHEPRAVAAADQGRGRGSAARPDRGAARRGLSRADLVVLDLEALRAPATPKHPTVWRKRYEPGPVLGGHPGSGSGRPKALLS